MSSLQEEQLAEALANTPETYRREDPPGIGRFDASTFVLGRDRRRRLVRIGWYDRRDGRSIRRWVADDTPVEHLPGYHDADDRDYMSLTFTDNR